MVRLRWVLVAALAAVAPLACGGNDSESTGALVWVKQPTVVKQATLPDDRVLVGMVRNDSLRRMRLEAKNVHALDENGTPLNGNATFIRGYVHPLFPPTRPPVGGLPDSELIRLGRVILLDPGKSTHLSVAWRLGPGTKPPVRIDYGFGWLPIRGG